MLPDMPARQHPLHNWIPYKLLITNGVPLVQWLYTEGQSFGEPFFEESIAGCLSHAYNSSHYKCLSSFESLIEWAETMPEVIPAAFIFHVSRCGSTVLSLMIGADDHYMTLSEVPLFDAFLRLTYTLEVSDALREQLLSAAIRFTAADRTGTAQRVFIKTDSWHIFYADVYRQLFPSTPMILLYRSPDEVIRSHRELRGMQAVPGLIEPAVFGFTKEEIAGYDLDGYTAEVLARYFSAFAALHEKDPRTLLLDYKQGVMPMLEALEQHLGMPWSNDHLVKMKERSGFHSKRPQQVFSEERPKTTLPAYQEKAMDLYVRLDNIRRQTVLSD